MKLYYQQTTLYARHFAVQFYLVVIATCSGVLAHDEATVWQSEYMKARNCPVKIGNFFLPAGLCALRATNRAIPRVPEKSQLLPAGNKLPSSEINLDLFLNKKIDHYEGWNCF